MKETESKLVACIQTALGYHGYMTLRVGQHIVKGSGSTPGVPDLLCCHPRGDGKALLLEIKTATGRLSTAQREFNETGLTRVARSPEEAIELAQTILGKVDR